MMEETTTVRASTRFNRVRSATVKICEPLIPEDYIPQPAEFVSPPKWHLAHTSWFFEAFILDKYLTGYQVFHPDYAYFFNSYYNSLGERINRVDRGNLSRPSLENILAYRHHVDHAMGVLLESDRGQSDEVLSLLEIGLNHEQQHQELLWTDIKYILGSNPAFPAYAESENRTAQINEDRGWLNIGEGIYEIGFEGQEFAYDNERCRHKIYLQEFSISKALVTNAEYLEFIESGGYEDHNYWHDEGWAWLQRSGVNSPLYWLKRDGSWWNYTLAGLQPLKPEHILAHVSHYEASAFASWQGKRLPTEGEWEVASDQLQWGTRWEHTNSAYLAYPGYKKPAGAVGEYNAKFMMNQMVLRGASSVTPAGHSRKTYRNFFHPDMQWQFSGIRLVEND